jgi:hypothetical protein
MLHPLKADLCPQMGRLTFDLELEKWREMTSRASIKRERPKTGAVTESLHALCSLYGGKDKGEQLSVIFRAARVPNVAVFILNNAHPAFTCLCSQDSQLVRYLLEYTGKVSLSWSIGLSVTMLCAQCSLIVPSVLTDEFRLSERIQKRCESLL